MSKAFYRVCFVLLWSASLAILFYLLWRGSSYYLTPVIERPRHTDYWLLKPGGTYGYLYGVAGTSLMLLMQLYSVRKRVKFLRTVGSLRLWLDLHIFCGIIGPLLIVLHSSFKIHGLVALSFWSMVAVALSGLFGRYLYLQVPRRRSGDELSLAEFDQMRAATAVRLREEFNLSEGELATLDALGRGNAHADTPLPMLLVTMPFSTWRLGKKCPSPEFSTLRHQLPPSELRQLTKLAKERALLERRMVLLSRLQALFHYWHVLHKPFAVVMYVFMLVHIAVVLATGYGWRWS